MMGRVPVGPMGLSSRLLLCNLSPRERPLHPAPVAPDEMCVGKGPELS